VKLLVGLGNPGPRYRATYHNIGFDVVDELALRHHTTFGTSQTEALTARVRGMADDVWLVKPQTFMNVSGRAVGALLRYYKLDPQRVARHRRRSGAGGGPVRLRPSGSAGATTA
jgi:PTH1 family peptidyl-tRNA hydrolase